MSGNLNLVILKDAFTDRLGIRQTIYNKSERIMKYLVNQIEEIQGG